MVGWEGLTDPEMIPHIIMDLGGVADWGGLVDLGATSHMAKTLGGVVD